MYKALRFAHIIKCNQDLDFKTWPHLSSIARLYNYNIFISNTITFNSIHLLYTSELRIQKVRIQLSISFQRMPNIEPKKLHRKDRTSEQENGLTTRKILGAAVFQCTPNHTPHASGRSSYGFITTTLDLYQLLLSQLQHHDKSY